MAAKSKKSRSKESSNPSVDKSVQKKKLKKKYNKLKHCDPSLINKSKKIKPKAPPTSNGAELENLKKSLSGKNAISSNWRTLMKNMKNEENQEKTPGETRPAFIRRNKAGQIITNQKMSHPRAVLVGQKDKKKKTKSGDTEQVSDIWFDGVDPLLLEQDKEDSAGGGLVKAESYQGPTRVLGMDCEMVGVGVGGQDSILARVSIVNHFGHTLYDKFVAPREKVTDYRTAVSGVRAEDLAGAPTFHQVQGEVAELIKDRVLVGHAIHHDLKVLFLDHPKKFIRDTSKYKPFKAAFGGRTPGLKALTERFVGVKVQSGEHSSVQDSQAAVRLYTMFRKDWEAARKERKVNNKNSSKKKKTKMVRYKKRYFVVEYERTRHIYKGGGLDLEPLNSRDVDVANAIKEKVLELHGDFGRAALSAGFKVIYANPCTRLVVIRCRHGPHAFLASALPFVTKIRNEAVIGRLLYTGATVRHCHMFMLNRQRRILEMYTASLEEDKSEQLNESIMNIRKIEPN